MSKYDNIELNEFHCNKKLTGKILSKEEMKKLRFSENEDKWSFFKPLKGEIELFVHIYKDNPSERVDIQIIDDDFGQPYDYQRYLERNPTHIFALQIQELVEKEISKLQEAGVISGHTFGEYI